jgi:outer membrane lipoprotein-sorting protein
MKRTAGLLMLCLSAALVAGVTRAEEAPDAREIVRKATQGHRSKDEKAKTEVVIVADGRKSKKRVADFLTLSEGENDRLLIRFVEPATIRGLSLLTVERGEREDQHIYVPALRKVKRIASNGKGNRFAGTDFTYEDLRGEAMARNDYALLGSEAVDGKDCWRIEATPKAGWASEETAYGKRQFWIRKDHHLIVRVDYFDKKKGKVLKTRTNMDYQQIKGKWRFRVALMKDLARKSKTALRVVERQLDVGLSKGSFTPAALGKQ